jgi:porphobilinogen synthase
MISRPRRLRHTPAIRNLVRETHLDLDGLIAPLFVVPGENIHREIGSMPEVYQMSVDRIVVECGELLALGINAVILFGVPDLKDAVGSGAYDENGLVQIAIHEIKQAHPEMLVVADVCLCEYTDHGHCGVLHGEQILNDETVDLLVRSSISLAEAGADIIAPSDMMDGRIGAIRTGLDGAGFESVTIMSYAVKYASGFYGPFRDAAGSTPTFGDRRTHQMDPANAREAMREVALDLEEGADIIMVKPALPCLDIIHAIYETTNVPLAAYQVSGEYAMIHAAARAGWLDLERVMLESLISIRRAGASIIITYFARRVAERSVKSEVRSVK